jgi:hypothetical protein
LLLHQKQHITPARRIAHGNDIAGKQLDGGSRDTRDVQLLQQYAQKLPGVQRLSSTLVMKRVVEGREFPLE